MAKPSKRIVCDFQRFWFHEIASRGLRQNPVGCSQPALSKSKNVSWDFHGGLHHAGRIWSRFHSCDPLSKSPSINVVVSRFLHVNRLNFSLGLLPSRKMSAGFSPNLPNLSSKVTGIRGFIEKGSIYRLISVKSFNSAKIAEGLGKSVISRPLSSIRSTFLRYREVIGLQLEAFWKRNYLFILGAGGLVLCIVLWRILFGFASIFVGISEGMAKYGFLALATAIVAFTGLYIRSRFVINPNKVYRIAMRKLNTSAPILELMGAPLAGTNVRAYIMSGGLPKIKNFKLRLGGKRCFLIFPIRGSERRGLVSVEVKKKKGQHEMKLLAVDIPMASGPDQRIFLIGDEQEYRVGGGLISELRDPIIKAMAAEKEFEALDLEEEEDDEKKEREEAERKKQDEEQRVLENEKRQRELESLDKVSS
ncbi:uncharacterized protein LOC110031321 [Phalaenopsis equestris]|uniref:uncharacterized protein LOC110031321 n=1 Tax=Phalaenopsis equestris TaxID=78828 RepID=UPI0009E4F941|nr:uncharacterized protein LOC110031321 [Phalaenopsis equestris]